VWVRETYSGVIFNVSNCLILVTVITQCMSETYNGVIFIVKYGLILVSLIKLCVNEI
jgi:hypothetical protein